MTKTERRVIRVHVSEVQPYYEQPRQWFDDLRTQELAESIRSLGQLTPCLVREAGPGKYQLVTGERRLRAIRDWLRQEHIDVVVASVGEGDAHFLAALADHVSHEDLSSSDLASAVRRVWDMPRFADYALTERRRVVGEVFGRSAAWVAQYVAISELHPAARELFEQHSLPPRAAQHVAQVQDVARQVALAGSLAGMRSGDATELARAATEPERRAASRAQGAVRAGGRTGESDAGRVAKDAYVALAALVERIGGTTKSALALPPEAVAAALLQRPERCVQLVAKLDRALSSLATLRSSVAAFAAKGAA